MFATKIAGKPYAGKPHVRIEEGARRSGNLASAFLYSTKIDDKGFSVKDEEKISVFFKDLKIQYESQTKHQLVSELNWISDFPKIGICVIVAIIAYAEKGFIKMLLTYRISLDIRFSSFKIISEV